MDCKMCQESMDMALDMELTTEAFEHFQQHLDACPDCRKQFEEMQNLLEALGEMPLKPLPENFKSELHEKLLKAQQDNSTVEKQKNNWFKTYGKQLSVAAVVTLVLGVSTSLLPQLGIMNNSYKNAEAVMDESYRGADGAMYDAASMETAAAPAEMAPAVMSPMAKDGELALENGMETTAGQQAGDTKSIEIQGRKVIQSSNFDLEVKVFDEAAQMIRENVQSSGGFIQDYNAYYTFGRDGQTQLKAGYLTIRVPSHQFELSQDLIKSLGKVVSQSANTQDITNQYRDTYNEKLNLEVREKQLREIMAQAVKIEDIILVEGELSRVRGEINRLSGTLLQWDGLVELATITINMREVEDFTTKIEPIKEDLWSKAVEAFNLSMNEMKRGMENLIIAVVAYSPMMVLWVVCIGAAAGVARIIYKRMKKGRGK